MEGSFLEIPIAKWFFTGFNWCFVSELEKRGNLTRDRASTTANIDDIPFLKNAFICVLRASFLRGYRRYTFFLLRGLRGQIMASERYFSKGVEINFHLPYRTVYYPVLAGVFVLRL